MGWCKFDHAGTGLHSTVNGFSISNCIFRNSLCGFHAANSDSAFCSNLLCEDITNESGGGVNFTSVNSGVVEKSIFCNSYNGLRVKDQVGVQIRDNMFTNNTNGVYLMSFTGDFINNELSENEYDISICGATSPDISYNIINSNTGVFLLTDVVYQNATPIIQKNNFYCKDWFIFLAYCNRFDIETDGNYFNGLTDIAEIKQKIMDKEDYAPNDQEFVGNVLINSVSSYTISGAGIHR
jgi:parallel beta-helix repeat protein